MAKAKARKTFKTSYRESFTLPNGKRCEVTTHSQAEKYTVSLHINKLIKAKNNGASALDSVEWAMNLPDGILKKSLIRWGLLEETETAKTVSDLARAFKNRKVKEWTLKSYQGLINNFIDFFGSDYLLVNIDRKKAGEFIKFLETSANRKTGKGLGAVSVSKRIERSRQFFNFCVNEGWLLKNPFAGYKGTGDVNKSNWRYITKEDCIRVIDSTPNRSHRAIIALLRFCGLRGVSELSRLVWSEDCYHHSTAGRPAEIVVHSTKTEHHEGMETRTIPLTPYVEQLLDELWETIPEGENRMFPAMLATSNPGVLVKKAFKRCGVDLDKPYNLRKSYVTDLMAGGLHEADPKLFELLAGHSLKMSLQHYQIITESRKEKAVGKFLEIMDNGTEKNMPTVLPTPAHSFAHRTNSQALAGIVTESEKSLENQSNCETLQNKKSPCENPQRALMWEAGLEPA